MSNAPLVPPPLESAQVLVDAGVSPVPVPYMHKDIREKGWPAWRISREELPQFFNGRNLNIGALNGEPSGGLTDVDLDVTEAVTIGPRFCPATGWIFGRRSKPRSHRGYRCAEEIKSRQFLDVDDGSTMLLELRSTGTQTLMPGSVHPTGEPIVWESFTTPAQVDARTLQRAAVLTAISTIIGRHWPREPGIRHHLALAYAGWLVRRMDGDTAADVVESAAEAAGDEDARSRRTDVLSTAKKHAAGLSTTGGPRVVELLPSVGNAVLKRIDGWLSPLGDVSPTAVAVTTVPQSFTGDREPPWPSLASAALCGLAGDIVRAIEPHTEADPAALLMNVLVGFGSAAGRGAHSRAEGSRHGLNLYAVTVGKTSRGRKGSAWARVRSLLERVDPEWADRCLTGGLASGEGLINAVRDASDKLDRDGNPTDPGARDKRALFVEEEFAAVLKVATRDGNTTSTALRQGWDSGTLRVTTRNSPLRATAAHVSVLGHVTRDELLKYLTETEYGSGFANRFLWICARRSKLLPDGGGDPSYGDVVPRLRGALEFTRTCAEPLTRDPDASALWGDEYPKLTEDREGLLGAITGRAEAQALRLSVLYAVLDQSPVVRREHLEAALAVWRYAEASAAYIFGDLAGDPTADRILEAIRDAGDRGLGKSEISNVLGRNVPAGRINAALRSLELAGRVAARREATAGRPREVYLLSSYFVTEKSDPE